MATLPVEYFTFSTKYPESGTRIQLGNSYQFDAPPDAPDQRIFVLQLSGMTYNVTGQTPASLDMAALEAFYNTHKRATVFEFNHPVYGTVNCKFNRSLQIPEGISGGGGVLPPFEIELVEQP